MIRLFAFAALSFFAAGPAAAQQTEPDIVVVGERTEEAVRGFVAAMSAPARGVDQLARWDRRICPGVAGLRGRYAQFLIDRMAQRAFDVDLDVGEPGCRPNILIVVTTDPDSVARELYDDHPAALGYFDESGEATRGRRMLRATFLNSDAPVRWWHVSHAASATGQEFTRPSGGMCALGEGGVMEVMRCYPTNMASGGASRLRATSRQDFGAAFIIVDANRLAEIDYDFNALADYVAMVALAQLDPQADVSGFPSVLNLWAGGGDVSPVALTDWDLAYLRGLYASERDARSIAAHEGDIAREMMRDEE